MYGTTEIGHAVAANVTGGSRDFTVGRALALPPQARRRARRGGPTRHGGAPRGWLPTAVAFCTWAYALSRTTAGKLGVTAYVVPVLVVLLSWLLLGEVPGPAALAGGALCLAGVAVSRKRPKRPTPTLERPRRPPLLGWARSLRGATSGKAL